jgi:hypothetical protein|tara:strand:+ start:155 stop:622 length:468 start_codon:yes stop_codon:yes gene_type:complete
MKSMKLILESWREKSLDEKQKSTEKYDDNKKLKGDQDELPDGLQKAIIKKAGGDPEEEEEKVEEANEGGEGVHDILNLPEPEAVESSGNPKVDALRQIVADKQYAKVDGVSIDLTTANLLLQILDALSPANKENFLGKPIEQMVSIAYKILGKQQ